MKAFGLCKNFEGMRDSRLVAEEEGEGHGKSSEFANEGIVRDCVFWTRQ